MAHYCVVFVKPLSPTEPTARVRAALRKRGRPDPFLVEELVIDYEKRRVTVGGRKVKLTVTEYELLRGAVDREDTEPVRTFVKKLRSKLGDDPASPTYLFNERGVGYRMAAPDDQ